jgi:hypothetical protein
MQYLRSLGLAALAAFSVMAVMGAGIASASEPTAVVTSPNTFPVAFHGHGGHGELNTTSNHQVTCTTSTSKGEISSASTAQNVEVTFTGCKAFFGFVNCNTAGQAAGVVKTNVLHATLVYLETNSSSKGLLLSPKAGTTFATLECGGTTITVTGQVLGRLVQVSHTQWTLHFEMVEKGHQKPALYLNPVGCGHISTTSALHAIGHGGFTPFATSSAGIKGTQTITLTKGTALTGEKCV